jgi:hypothetical protein
MKTNIKYLPILLVFVLAACGGGGGETNQDVVNRFKPQYDMLRTQLQQAVQKIPQQVGEPPVTQPLTPRPAYTKDAKEPQNTDVLMYENLLDPDAKLNSDTQLDLTLTNHLLRALQWTGTHNPMSEAALKNKATDNVLHDLEQGLQLKYLAVAKVVAYQPVVAVDKDTYSGGQAAIDGYLIDLSKQAVVCSFGVSVSPPKQIDYKYAKGEDQAEALAKAARSSAWSSAREEFIAALNNRCGGDFALR